MIPDRHGGRLADTYARLRGHDLRIHPAADGQHLRATCGICQWAALIMTGHTVTELQRLTDHHNGRPT